MTEKSKNHKTTIGNFEYFTHNNGDLYRAPIANPVMPDGYRGGARWQAPSHMVEEWLEMLEEL